MSDKNLSTFLSEWGGQVKAMIENSSASSEPDYMSKSDFDSAISAFNASQWSSRFEDSWHRWKTYAPYNLYRLADDYIISLLPIDEDKYDYTDASKKIQLAEMAYKLTNGQLIESTDKIEPTLTYIREPNDAYTADIDNYNGGDGYNRFQFSYDGDGMLACKIDEFAGWAYFDKYNIMSVAVAGYNSGYIYIKAYEGHTYKAKIITIRYQTND